MTWHRVYALPEATPLAALHAPRGSEPEPIAILAIDPNDREGFEVLGVDEEGRLIRCDFAEVVIVDHRVDAAIRQARDGVGS